EDGIRDDLVTGVQTCALPILNRSPAAAATLSRPGFFLGLGQNLEYRAPGVYETVAWRSTNDLKTIETVPVVARVPDGPLRKRRRSEERRVGKDWRTRTAV